AAPGPRLEVPRRRQTLRPGRCVSSALLTPFDLGAFHAAKSIKIALERYACSNAKCPRRTAFANEARGRETRIGERGRHVERVERIADPAFDEHTRVLHTAANVHERIRLLHGDVRIVVGKLAVTDEIGPDLDGRRPSQRV